MCWKTWFPRVLRKTEETTGNCRVFEASTARVSGQGRKRDGWWRKSEKLEKSVMYNHIAPRINLLFCEVGQTSWGGPWSRRERLILPTCRPSSCPYPGMKPSPSDLTCALPAHVLNVVFKAPLADWAKLSLLACIHFSTERQEGKWTSTTNRRHSPICLTLFLYFPDLHCRPSNPTWSLCASNIQPLPCNRWTAS